MQFAAVQLCQWCVSSWLHAVAQAWVWLGVLLPPELPPDEPPEELVVSLFTVVEEPEPTTPTVDPSALTVGTNVGTTLKKDDSGRFDCTIRMSDSIQLILRGTDAAVTWSSEDTSVVTVSADGKLKPVKAGTANVTASVGGATVRCVVRINN